MATATQISTRALKRLGIVPSGGTPSAEDIADANDELSALITSFEADALSGDVTPLDSRFENALVDMLALRLTDFFGVQPTELLARDAQRGETQLKAAFFVVPEQTYDSGLAFTGYAATYVGLLVDASTSPIPDWQASYTYVIRQYVKKSGNIYECVTAGTSGSTGPTGTDASITDGTVTWCWRQVTDN